MAFDLADGNERRGLLVGVRHDVASARTDGGDQRGRTHGEACAATQDLR